MSIHVTSQFFPESTSKEKRRDEELASVVLAIDMHRRPRHISLLSTYMLCCSRAKFPLSVYGKNSDVFPGPEDPRTCLLLPWEKGCPVTCEYSQHSLEEVRSSPPGRRVTRRPRWAVDDKVASFPS